MAALSLVLVAAEGLEHLAELSQGAPAPLVGVGGAVLEGMSREHVNSTKKNIINLWIIRNGMRGGRQPMTYSFFFI